MKIYQVIEYGGEWEDSYEIVAGTYIIKSNAELKLLELEDKKTEGLKRGKRCEHCENHWEESENKRYLQEIGLELRKKCRFAKISIEKYKVTRRDGDEEGYSMHCENFVYSQEDVGYKIKEFEIEDFQDLYTINSTSTTQSIANGDFCESICGIWGKQGDNI